MIRGLRSGWSLVIERGGNKGGWGWEEREGEAEDLELSDELSGKLESLKAVCVIMLSRGVKSVRDPHRGRATRAGK